MTMATELHEPVFIVGMPRSGSSILYRLVQEHPRFRPAHGLDLSESHFLDALVGGGDLDTLSVRAFAALDDSAWPRLESRLATFDGRRRLAAALPRRSLTRSVGLWRALGLAQAARAYFAVAAQARGVDRLVEKTPNNLPWARHLLRAFPDARLLVICRHPLTAYASFRRRAEQDPAAGWADVTPEGFGARWERDVRLLTALTADPAGRLRIERYEQLVGQPDDVQRSLFGWLGEAPLDDLPSAVAPNPHGPPSDRSQLASPIGDTGTRWADHVTQVEAAALERALAAPMALLGYEPLAAEG